MKAFVLIWEFEAKPGLEKEFERNYSSDGDWCKLFCSSPAYRKTELLKDTVQPNRFVTLDYWESQNAYAEFKLANQHLYESIDKKCQTLTNNERFLGSFITVADD